MLVHITLEKAFRKDADAMRVTLGQINAVAPLSDLNQGRLERYGLITADVPEAALEKIRKVHGVRSVQGDAVRHTMS